MLNSIAPPVKSSPDPSLWHLCRRFVHYLPARRRWHLAGVLALTFLGMFGELATLGAVLPFLALLAAPASVLRYPLVAQAAALLGWRNATDLLLPATLLFVTVALLAGAVRTLLSWASLKFTYGVGVDMGRAIFRRLLYRPFAYHAAHNTSDAIASINQVSGLVSSFLNPLIQTLVSFVFTIAILAALLRIDPGMALSAGGGFALIYLIATFVSRRRLAANSAITARAEGARILAIQEGLGGIRDIILDGAQELYVNRFWRHDAQLKGALASNSFLGVLPRFLIESIGVALIAAIAYGATRHAGAMAVVIPSLGALALGAQKIIPQMQQLYFGWATLNGNREIVARLIAQLDQPDPEGPAPARAPLPFHRRLALRDVTFRYSPDGPEVVRRLSLEIERGARVGFVGKTGSGKSTLIDLIMGLLEPTDGVIEVDGRPLAETSRRAWQAGIAHVPQSIFLSDTSLAENIAFGCARERIDMVRVREAARKAQLAEFIETLPEKYETFVGERGVRLSGGQRQRVGLARAFYKDAQLLILDEATSALDNATEAAVMRAVGDLGGSITVLMIAHRISTLRDCDTIFELHAGGVLRRGRYAELFSSR